MNDYYDILNELSNQSLEIVQKKLQLIENTKIKLDTNMNLKLLMDEFIIKFSEVK